MFPSGQWSFNPSAYQNIPYEQVDWASLAQQWIKMKETIPPLNQGPPPHPATQILKKESPPVVPNSPPSNDIEGGEAPMDMDTKDDDLPGSVGATTSGNWNQWGNWENQWGWSWSGNTSSVPSGENTTTSSSVDSKVKSSINDSKPVLNTYVSNVGNFPVIGNAATCTPQVAGSFNYSNNVGGILPPILPKSAMWNESSFPSDTVKSNSETWSKGNRTNSRQAQKQVAVEQFPVMDAAKKKQLPAWIREGLTKMEREKQKKLDRERMLHDRSTRDQIPAEDNPLDENQTIMASDIPNSQIADELSKKTVAVSDISSHSKTNVIIPSMEPPRSRPSRISKDDASLIRKTKDEIMEESMLKVRRILTEILLEATENQVLIIAKEELRRAKSASAQAVRKSNALSSLSGNLGLNIYDSDDSDSSSNEHVHSDKRFDSDEELKMLIDHKKREFRKIESEIELEIESQEAREKLVAQQDDDNDESGSNDDDKKEPEVTKPLDSSFNDATYKRHESVNEDSRSTQESDGNYGKVEIPCNYPTNNHELSSEVVRSTNQVNGDRKNEKIETKRSKSLSSSSSSSDSSKSSSSSSETSASSGSRSSSSSSSPSDSDSSSYSSDDRKRKKRVSKISKASKKPPAKRKRYRSLSRSESREKRSSDSRNYSSKSRKSDSYSRKISSPYRRRSRSRQRSSSRGRDSSRSKYSDFSKRYDTESKRTRRRSSSPESRRSRYKRR